MKASTEVLSSPVAEQSAVASAGDDESEPGMESIVDTSAPTPSLLSILGVGDTDRDSLLQVDNYVEEETGEDDCGYIPSGASRAAGVTTATSHQDKDDDNDVSKHAPTVLSDEAVNLLLAGKFEEQRHCAAENSVRPFEFEEEGVEGGSAGGLEDF
jgi:hypothetical protein